MKNRVSLKLSLSYFLMLFLFIQAKTSVKFERAYQLADVDSIGQIGGLDVDLEGNLAIFHRAERKYSTDLFDNNGNFDTKKYKTIQNDVLSFISTNSWITKNSWGARRFYMPHGIKIDQNSNIWLTDVGMHQVFKFNFKISQEPMLILGTAFIKGNDAFHFCMPADVDINNLNEDIFVADGCNQRIVSLNKNGKFLKSYEDKSNPLIEAHSVSLINELKLVCTVSRDQGRIVCFDIDSGLKKFDFANINMNQVFSIRYDFLNKQLYATGFKNGIESVGLTFDASQENFGKFLQKWNAQGHNVNATGDLAVPLAIPMDGKKIFLGRNFNAEIDIYSLKSQI